MLIERILAYLCVFERIERIQAFSFIFFAYFCILLITRAYWSVLERIGAYWNVLERIGAYWNVSERIGTYWSVLSVFLLMCAYWSVLSVSKRFHAYSCIFLHTLDYSCVLERI